MNARERAALASTVDRVDALAEAMRADEINRELGRSTMRDEFSVEIIAVRDTLRSLAGLDARNVA